jgi:three-Cys-motif partner protein
MIAISALKDAQQKIFETTKVRRTIRCFFSEIDPAAFAKLQAAVAPYNRPQDGFEIKTYCGKFEDAVSEIKAFVGPSFALIFIDPTGWTGYSFEKIKTLFAPRLCEVLINFMYGFVHRFVDAEDEDIVESLNPILGGPGWRDRLDPTLSRGDALVKLFRETLKSVGKFSHVVATKIDKATEDRPHFFMAYGTKDYAGLKTFRDIEHKALQRHALNRAGAKERKKEAKTGLTDMFAAYEVYRHEEAVVDDVRKEMGRAAPVAIEMISKAGSLKFEQIAAELMENFRLREPNVKDILCLLARDGKIENSWGGGNRKPKEGDIIRSM